MRPRVRINSTNELFRSAWPPQLRAVTTGHKRPPIRSLRRRARAGPVAQRGRKFRNHSVIELLTSMSQSPLAETIAVCARSNLFRIALLVFIGLVCDFAVAQYVPTPRPRPVQGQGEPSDAVSKPHETPGPSACRLQLTSEWAVAPSLPPITGPGECGADDVVRLEAVVLPDKTRVAISPPGNCALHTCQDTRSLGT